MGTPAVSCRQSCHSADSNVREWKCAVGIHYSTNPGLYQSSGVADHLVICDM